MEKNAGLLSLEYRNRIHSLWDNYLRFKPDIDFTYIRYYDMPVPHGLLGGASISVGSSSANKTLKGQARDMAEALSLDFDKIKSPEELKRIVDLQPELNRYVM